jgi:hypothetical protein
MINPLKLHWTVPYECFKLMNKITLLKHVRESYRIMMNPIVPKTIAIEEIKAEVFNKIMTIKEMIEEETHKKYRLN